MAITERELKRINGRARQLIRLDQRWQWREAINICGYSVFDEGVNVVPRLIAEIRRLKKELRELKA